MKMKEKTIEQKYQQLSEQEHILRRSGMYIGSVKEEEKQVFIYDSENDKMILTDISYTPGLLKLIDEIVSNTGDEYRRKDNMGLTDIEVDVYRNGHFRIKDNGGIPVVKHKEVDMYVPQFIFSTMRASSNFDDTEERDVIGTNGLGVKLLVIFSKYFSVYTADKNKSFFRSWSDNMQTMNNDLKVVSCKDHFTEFHFDIDWDRFEDVSEVTDDFAAIIEKRIIDLCAANPGLHGKFTFKDGDEIIKESEWEFESFEDYIDMYLRGLHSNDYIDFKESVIKFADKQKSVWIYPDDGLNIGFVNGAECSKGTHIKAIRSEINTAIAEQIKSKNKIEVQPKDVDNKYTMFCTYHIANPTYDSQTKDTLTTPVERFSMEKNYKFNIPTSFIKECCKSDIVNDVIEWYKRKSEVEDEKTRRKLNKEAKQKIRNEKFIDANTKVTRDKELWIFEGFSAGASFRTSRLNTQGCYLLKGKVLNTAGLGPSKIMANQELHDIITILGLQWGEKNPKENLNFGKIVICSDADEDGSAICGLLLNFFALNFPELFEYGMICRAISPIIIATKGKDVKNYYTMPEYHNDAEKLKGYKIKYIKGLGSLEPSEFKDMMQKPIFHYFNKDEMADINLKSWFNKTESKTRKEMLKNEVESN
ncbi:MAG: DNA topoisomerase II large subunit [Wendovervirus sonii]|uniref:DNA topoisomerase (ATP-hydrolyzing) n=1 Tax=phage Lak_Megaphage_Sonny TaxID=3109229 RepID=A0ABZ0Z581_9CAUD|nr:MAG: DNA topoisomerase II large subunit [phage Lak_Megaphage_Sonny]